MEDLFGIRFHCFLLLPTLHCFALAGCELEEEVEDLLNGIRFHPFLLLHSYFALSGCCVITESDNTLRIVEGVTFQFTLSTQENCN